MRVLVTRPRAEGEAVAAALIARGHQPVLAPVMTIVALPFVLPAGRRDAVLLTSQHAAAMLPATAREALAPLPAYAVGTSTATAARRGGFRDVRVGAGDAAAMLDLMILTLPRGARLLYLAGRVRKTHLPSRLEAAGYHLSTVETYDAPPVADWAGTLRDRPFEACLHFSRRAAEHALAGSRGDLRARFDSALHLCLSDDVAAALRQAGLPHIASASVPTLASLLQGLDHNLA